MGEMGCDDYRHDCRVFDAFVFDLDGTLIDTLPDLVAVTNEALASTGFSLRSVDEILSYVGNGPRALLQQALPAGTSDGDIERTFSLWQDIHARKGVSLARPYPHVRETVFELKRLGCKVAVLSNKFDAGVHQVVDACLPGLFDALVGEGPDTPRKPDPTGYLKLMADLDVRPERCAYVGDSPSDVRVARNAGTYAIGVTWGYRRAEDFIAAAAQPDRWIDDMRELLELVSLPA